MADMIKCPVCGQDNPAGQEFCEYCQSRLQPLTGPLKGADAPLQPGQIPTKKVTAELEPILPQWLREARDQARLPAEENALQGVQSFEPTPAAGNSEPDLLAGLKSQSRTDDDDDTPDWLASITGASPRSKKADAIDPVSREGRRVELGEIGDFARDTAPLQESTPSWVESMQAASQENEKDELKDWFRESSGLGAQKDESTSDPASWMGQQSTASAGSNDAPDWLKQMTPDEDGAAAPAWLEPEVRDETTSATASPFAGADLFGAGSSTGDVPSWLESAGSPATPTAAPADQDWLKNFDSPKPDQPLKKNTTPLWLKGMDSTGTPAAEPETPVWLEDETPSSSFVPPIEPPPASPGDEQIGFGEIPDWLKAAAPQSSIFDSPSVETPSTPAEPTGWLNTFKSNEPAASLPLDQPDQNVPAAFTPDAFQDGNADALFTEMPDWLSNASTPASTSAASAAGADPLTPGDLPSWVQAMRPVDTGLSQAASRTGDQTLETRGALSGLHGVLPAVPGFAPTSKPKIYSIKLQATQEQQAHAALLEQILEAEAEPVPITSFSPLRPSRLLRWALSSLMLGVILAVTFTDTRVFSMPVGVPNEFNGALQVAQNVPEGAAVLVAVDYQPARAGEMEAAAAPMFDQMIVLRHPRLAFISTDETGPLMAERFISGPLAERGYQYGSQYVNLGYLPGGMIGIRSFTQNPVNAMPFDVFLAPAWASIPLQGITSFSQFAAFIVITDNADSARAWIEQTTFARGSAPLVIISSAQAAPMVQPYYDSGQVNGIVSGLYGGAIFEQNNAGRPGTARRYWDAYSLGMLLTLPLMLGGGLWSLALGLRDRAATRDGRPA
jgi:hypothetical protein